MAKLQVFTWENLQQYDPLIKGYVDNTVSEAEASSLKTVAIDGNTLKFYKVGEPVGETAPAYTIELPETDISNLMSKLTGAATGNVVTVGSDGEVADGGVALTDLATKEEVGAVEEAIEAINNDETGILKSAKDYADEKVAELANGTVATNVSDIATLKETVQNIQENAYDDTELKGLISDNATAIEGLDARVEDTEGRLDAIENADTGILASAKSYTDETVEDAVEAVKASLASALTYKGQKNTESDLPTEGNACGDVWTVLTVANGTGAEFVWVVDDVDAGTGHWEELGTAVDMEGYATKEAVSSDIATAKSEAIAATTALEEGKVADNATAISDLQDLVGEGYEEIPLATIQGLFA